MIGSIVAGLLGAGLAVALHWLAIFVTGAMAGAAVATGVCTAIFHDAPPPIVLIIAGIIGGVVAVLLFQLLVVIITSFFGSIGLGTALVPTLMGTPLGGVMVLAGTVVGSAIQYLLMWKTGHRKPRTVQTVPVAAPAFPAGPPALPGPRQAPHVMPPPLPPRSGPNRPNAW